MNVEAWSFGFCSSLSTCPRSALPQFLPWISSIMVARKIGTPKLPVCMTFMYIVAMSSSFIFVYFYGKMTVITIGSKSYGVSLTRHSAGRSTQTQRRMTVH